jgi:hypothetical protein
VNSGLSGYIFQSCSLNHGFNLTIDRQRPRLRVRRTKSLTALRPQGHHTIVCEGYSDADPHKARHLKLS